MKCPAVWMAAACIAGIAAGLHKPGGLLLWLGVAGTSLLAAFVLHSLRRNTAALVLGFVAWLAVGGFAASLEPARIPGNNVAKLIDAGRLDVSQPLRWRGQLRENPLKLPWGTRLEMDLQQVDFNGNAVPLSGGLRVNYYSSANHDDAFPPLRAGDAIEVLTRIRVPRNFMDPGAFDERGFLERQGLYATASLRSAELADVPPSSAAPAIGVRHRLARWRGRCMAQLDALFAGRPERAALARAMLLGDRSFVDSDLAVTFQKTAAYHVLVVAGLHIAALAFFVVWPSRRLRWSALTTAIISLTVLGAYVAMVQDRPPILRAALMAALFLVSRLFFRRVALLNSVAFAALALLLARPTLLRDPSFQLSFLAAAVIAGIAVPWMQRSSTPYQHGLAHLGDVTRDGVHAPRVAQFRLDLRAASKWLAARLPARLASVAPRSVTLPCRFALRLWELVLVSTTLQLGMMPLLATYFHRVSLTGPISNIPAVLLTGLIVPFGFAALVFSFVWMRAARLLAWFGGMLISALVSCVEWFSRWPGASYRIPGPPAWVVAAFFALLIVLCWVARPGERHSAAGAPNVAPRSRVAAEWMAACGVLALAVVVATYPFGPTLAPGKLEVTVLDVGQGDSLFVAFPGGRTMLVDGGGLTGETRTGGYRSGSDVGESVVSPYLWTRGLKRIDVVALTHAHHDHLDGLYAVLDNFRVSELWVGHDVDSPAYTKLIAAAQQHGVTVRHQVRGNSFEWGGVSGRVLWPADSSMVEKATNNDSLVLKLQDGSTRFLLTGDIERPVEAKLLAGGDDLTSDFLKVGHHGSKTSSSAEFLQAVAPRTAVISVGKDNSYGHPSPSILDLLRQDGIRYLETEDAGAVTALSDGRAISLTDYAESN